MDHTNHRPESRDTPPSGTYLALTKNCAGKTGGTSLKPKTKRAIGLAIGPANALSRRRIERNILQRQRSLLILAIRALSLAIFLAVVGATTALGAGYVPVHQPVAREQSSTYPQASISQIRLAQSSKPMEQESPHLKLLSDITLFLRHSGKLGLAVLMSAGIIAAFIAQAQNIESAERILKKWIKEIKHAMSNPFAPRDRIPHNLPDLSLVPHRFLGRKEELKKLAIKLGASGSRVLITGMGGVGKSELALQFAYAQLEHYRGGIVRLDGRLGFEGMAAEVISFVRGWFPDLLPKKGLPDELLTLCWRQWPATNSRKEPVLLLVDDLPSDAKADEAVSRLFKGIPPRFRRLITRREKAPLSIASINLSVLKRPYALRLLRQHGEGQAASASRIDAEASAADELCMVVGDLPLALVLLGARLAQQPDLLISALLQELIEKGAEAKVLMLAHPELGARQGVIESLLISWAPLTDGAKKLAILLSLMAPALLPWDLVESCQQDEHKLIEDSVFGDAQAELLNAQLLERAGPGLYQLHPLVRSFMSLQAVGPALETTRNIWRKQYANAVAALCRESFSKRKTPALEAQIEDLAPHISMVAEHMIDSLTRENLYHPHKIMGQLYLKRANYLDGINWLRKCLDLCERHIGTEHEETMAVMVEYAVALAKTNKLDDAESLLRQAIAIGGRCCKPNDPKLSLGIYELAGLLLQTNRFKEAEALLRQALWIDETNHGPNDLDVARDLTSLGGVLLALWKCDEAQRLVCRAMKIYETTSDPQDTDIPHCLDVLATILSSTDRTDEAEPLYLKALSINEDRYGIDHPELCATLNNLAILYKETNRSAKAEALFLRILTIYEKRLGPDHPDLAAPLANLANLLATTSNRLDEAETLCRRALMIIETSYKDSNHHYVASIYGNLADILIKTNRLVEAEPLLRSSLAIREASFDPIHPEVAAALGFLSSFLMLTDQHQEAEKICQRALMIAEKACGKEHHRTASILYTYASIILDSKPAEAESLCRRALAINEAIYGTCHTSVACGLLLLAQAAELFNRTVEAERLCRRALAIYESRFGDYHSDVANALNHLAHLLILNNQSHESELHCLRALNIYETYYSHDSSNVAGSLYNLASVMEATDRFSEAEAFLSKAIEIKTKICSEDDPGLINIYDLLALVLFKTGRREGAEHYCRRTLRIAEVRFKVNDARIARCLHHLAIVTSSNGRNEEAEELAARSLIIEGVNSKVGIPPSGSARSLYQRLLRQRGVAETEIEAILKKLQGTDKNL